MSITRLKSRRLLHKELSLVVSSMNRLLEVKGPLNGGNVRYTRVSVWGREVVLVPLTMLQTHEDVDEKRVSIVAGRIIASGVVEKPLLVDKKTMVIIDGHHRYHALRILGARYAPVILLDYERDVITINAAARRITTINPEKTMDIVEEALTALASRGPYPIVIKSPGFEERIIYRDALEVYRAIKHTSIFKPNDGALRDSSISASRLRTVVIHPPALSRDHVRIVGLEEETLPMKSTLHVTPFKRVRLPISVKKLI